MSLLQTEKTAQAVLNGSGDTAAINELRVAFEAQRRAFAADRQPSLAERCERLQQIISVMLTNRERILAALSADFGAHPGPAAEVLEVFAVTARAEYALAHLEEWMQPMPREVDPAYKGILRALIKSQPKGVVGNIVPWNFPFEIGIGPMVDMLAAGNRVMLKPSEFTPASGALMREMVSATFAPDLVYVAVGGLELARAFTALPFDHLLYTGSANVGRQVMAAAAQNLTPVTLELGGKCPAVLLPNSVTAESVGNVLGVKMIKNGQMCVTVDHCFVPRAELDTFARIATEFMAQAAPDYSQSAACTGIISERHLDRMTDLLTEAEDRGARIITLEKKGVTDRETRQMPMSLVLDPAPDLRMMREEIFGPLLPVIPYDEVDEVIERINDGDRPLGVYVFGDDVAAIEHILGETSSGGGAVNACAIQAGLKALAFGGVGMSGMGRHHGEEGFREFSNQRGIVVRGEGPHFDAFVSPAQSAVDLVGQVPSG
jgi:coniferyl-aldehyde dehydrogenase